MFLPILLASILAHAFTGRVPKRRAYIREEPVYEGSDDSRRDRGGKQYTRPSDTEALLALWEANGEQGTLIGWGKGDPCVGKIPKNQRNAQGFGPWKGVGCVPCPEDPSGDMLCVSQIWQHQKNLNGTIPEEFRGLTELEWLFLSANNLTGPMPQSNWITFPKLHTIDISYNNINGDLPLDKISSIPTLEVILAHDNHFDSVSYHGGGFSELRHLDFNYNRNMSGLVPCEPLSKLPQLQTLAIHDTNLTGPCFNGPWPAMATLIITGTGGLCGPHPDVCSRKGVFCDVPLDYPFPPCHQPQLIQMANGSTKADDSEVTGASITTK